MSPNISNPLFYFSQSKNYKAFLPCTQFVTSGNASDLSGNGATGYLLAGLTDANAWANSGYLSTVAAVNGGVSIPLTKMNFDLATQSIILSAKINSAAAPAASFNLFGLGDGVSSQGFYLSARATSGKVRPVLNTSGGVVNALADSNAVFCDGTDHVITVAIDGLTKSVYLYRDGVLSNSYAGVFTGGTPSIVTDFYIGQASAVGQTATVMKTNGIHFLAMTGGLPSNISQIARVLASDPLIQLSNGVLSL